MAEPTRERPILFSGPMVKAILDGRKTQTRRIVKPQPKGEPASLERWFAELAASCRSYDPAPAEVRERAAKAVGRLFPFDDGSGSLSSPQCPYRVGDRLWVRETVRTADAGFGGDNYYFAADSKGVGLARYAALVKRFPWKYGRVIPSIHMPREAARLFLRVVAVRVERLSAISGEDVIADGFDLPTGVDESHVARDRGNVSTALRFDFLSGFRQLNKLAPDADPFVWVYTFEKDGG